MSEKFYLIEDSVSKDITLGILNSMLCNFLTKNSSKQYSKHGEFVCMGFFKHMRCSYDFK